MTLIIHPHFHKRYTGVTRHVESVVPSLVKDLGSETRVMGSALSEDLPRITWPELLRRSRMEPVVWHAHRNNELLAGMLLKLVGRQVRLVFTRHTSMEPSGFTRFLARGADALVSLTRQVAEVMGLPSTVISHGIDLKRFHPPEDRAKAWERLGQGRRFGVGVIGRVRKEKGQGDFLEAVRPLLPGYPEWQSVLVGLAKGSDLEWINGLRAGIEDRVSLVGEQSVIEPWYQGLTVLVHPSYVEGYSLVHVEAMASGCCVVASKLPYLDTLIEHGRTGFFFEPGDAKALRELLDMLMREPERAREVGRNAAEEARRRCGVEHEAHALGSLYRTLVGR
ncbi:glycosyltransferase family 4 protein [Myxococcus landrumensis]|uniref:Glycosyltransferase family 4 protein n=1 Tax=Myxococcus landrumensis TaxID=2813577 RepID=A0ABX7NAK6_9BACT|nr:glycosyltransferase family 4 protein [Myxococcus landrumus]QSQ14665.1 glycosyltransferase family 4 protein [Myxococcus landrumus]